MAGLREAVEGRKARLGVLGMGYVGAPVAARFAEVGFDVVGHDIDLDRVRAVSGGAPPFDGGEPGLADLMARVTESGRLRATADPDGLRDRDVLIVAVETPVEAETHLPGYSALRSALQTIGERLSPGRLVIVESTLAPGTTRDLVVPVIEVASGLRVGEEVLVAHCPERVMPGRLLRNLSTMSRVVGGVTPEAAEVAAALYRHVVEAELDQADALTAEIVKTAENAYRDVQIAFANELALICEDLGADVWRVRELVNQSPGRAVLLPGAGVGGHCIPKDPWLLISGVTPSVDGRLIQAARAVNDAMPLHVASLLRDELARDGRPTDSARVAVLGYAYLEDSDDDRNSPSEVLVRRLEDWGSDVRVHDPWVPRWRGSAVEEVVNGADAVVLMTAHGAYRSLDWHDLRAHSRGRILIDGRGAIDPSAARSAGWRVRTLGVGVPDTPPTP